MAVTCASVLSMAKRCFWITTSLESAPFLYAGNACEGHADVWPALPFVIQDYLGLKQKLDNIAALFEHSDRMCNIDPWGMHNSDHLEKIGAAMQGPSPELTDLHLRAYRDPVPVFPDSFLAGPAPRLRPLLRLDHFYFQVYETIVVYHSSRVLFPSDPAFRPVFTRDHVHCTRHVDQPRIA